MTQLLALVTLNYAIIVSQTLINISEFSKPKTALQWIDKSVSKTEWVNDVVKFREALLSGQRDIVKSYFDFPISDPGNDIWYVVDMRLASGMDSKKIVPFKDNDFDKYYSELFGVDFRKTLEVIDLNQLSKVSSIQSKKLAIISGSKSYMKASYDNSKKILTLEVISESSDFGRFSFQYHFRVINNVSIRFRDMTFIM